MSANKTCILIMLNNLNKFYIPLKQTNPALLNKALNLTNGQASQCWEDLTKI